jgi:hypothetical protein
MLKQFAYIMSFSYSLSMQIHFNQLGKLFIYSYILKFALNLEIIKKGNIFGLQKF